MGKLTLTDHLKACAEAAKNFTSGLVGELATTVTEAMNEMNEVKADKLTMPRSPSRPPGGRRMRVLPRTQSTTILW